MELDDRRLYRIDRVYLGHQPQHLLPWHLAQGLWTEKQLNHQQHQAVILLKCARSFSEYEDVANRFGNRFLFFFSKQT